MAQTLIENRPRLVWPLGALEPEIFQGASMSSNIIVDLRTFTRTPAVTVTIKKNNCYQVTVVNFQTKKVEKRTQFNLNRNVTWSCLNIAKIINNSEGCLITASLVENFDNEEYNLCSVNWKESPVNTAGNQPINPEREDAWLGPEKLTYEAHRGPWQFASQRSSDESQSEQFTPILPIEPQGFIGDSITVDGLAELFMIEPHTFSIGKFVEFITAKIGDENNTLRTLVQSSSDQEKYVGEAEIGIYVEWSLMPFVTKLVQAGRHRLVINLINSKAAHVGGEYLLLDLEKLVRVLENSFEQLQKRNGDECAGMSDAEKITKLLPRKVAYSRLEEIFIAVYERKIFENDIFKRDYELSQNAFPHEAASKLIERILKKVKQANHAEKIRIWQLRNNYEKLSQRYSGKIQQGILESKKKISH